MISDTDVEAFRALEAKVVALEQRRPTFVERVRLKMTGHPEADAEYAKRLASFEAAFPEAVTMRAEVEAKRPDVEAYLSANAARAMAREATEAALACLAGVPRVQSAVRGELKQTEALDVVESFDAKPAAWCLLLLGGIGTGKSTAAGRLAFTTAKANGAGMFSSGGVEWVRAVEASRLSGFGDETESRFRSWRETKLLVLDDVGTEVMTPTWQQALDDVLDWRYQHSARTLITSNLDKAGFKARYGERLADRIREDGVVHQLGGASMRKAGA